MPLTWDVRHERKHKLQQVLQRLIMPVRQYVSTAVVVGSLGYNWHDEVFTTSDLDLLVVADRKDFQRIAAHALNLGKSERDLHLAFRSACGDKAIDFISLKHTCNAIPFTLHLLEPTLFRNLCQFRCQSYFSFRVAAKEGAARFYNYSGESVPYKFVNEPLTYGYAHEAVTSLCRDQQWYVGVLHGRLLHCPHVYFDATKDAAKLIQRLWDDFVHRLWQESSKPLDLSQKSPLLALVNSRHFRPTARQHVINGTIDVLRRFRIRYCNAQQFAGKENQWPSYNNTLA